MNLTQMIEYLKETREVVPYLKSEAMDEIITHLENLNQIKPIGFYSTPANMEDLQNYLSQFNGSEGAVANIGAFMTFNLMVKIIKDEGEKQAHTATKIEEDFPSILKPQAE